MKTLNNLIVVHDTNCAMEFCVYIDSNESIYLASHYERYHANILHKNGSVEKYKLDTKMINCDLKNSTFDVKISGNLSIPIYQDNSCDDYQLPERLEYLDYIPIYLIK